MKLWPVHIEPFFLRERFFMASYFSLHAGGFCKCVQQPLFQVIFVRKPLIVNSTAENISIHCEEKSHASRLGNRSV